MIGVLVITHGNLARELINVAQFIKGDISDVTPISVDATKSVESVKKEMIAAIKKADNGKGVMILTDLFGGTPSNISLSFLKKNKVEVVTGVNLPMLLKMCELRGKNSLAECAEKIKEYGKKNIYLASEVLARKAGT